MLLEADHEYFIKEGHAVEATEQLLFDVGARLQLQKMNRHILMELLSIESSGSSKGFKLWVVNNVFEFMDTILVFSIISRTVYFKEKTNDEDSQSRMFILNGP